ncbi:MAG: RNA polymerase sigma factor [Ignavibacteriaceae bacterium]
MLDSLKFEILIKQYKNNIYNYALYMMKNRMDADDITQEVFIKIWNNINNFNIKSAKSWILRTTHNLCIDYLRKRQTSQKRETNIDSNINISGAGTLTDTEVRLRKNLLKDKIKQGIETLPDNLKSVFILYELQGFKYNEISETLSMPLNSVKVYLMRARKKLQEELKEYKNENN